MREYEKFNLILSKLNGEKKDIFVNAYKIFENLYLRLIEIIKIDIIDLTDDEKKAIEVIKYLAVENNVELLIPSDNKGIKMYVMKYGMEIISHKTKY